MKNILFTTILSALVLSSGGVFSAPNDSQGVAPADDSHGADYPPKRPDNVGFIPHTPGNIKINNGFAKRTPGLVKGYEKANPPAGGAAPAAAPAAVTTASSTAAASEDSAVSGGKVLAPVAGKAVGSGAGGIGKVGGIGQVGNAPTTETK